MSGDSPFGPDAIAKSVHATLDAAFSAIPADRKHAVIIDATTVDGGSARAMFVQRVDHGWNIVLEGDVDRAHGVSGAVTVAKSW